MGYDSFLDAEWDRVCDEHYQVEALDEARTEALAEMAECSDEALALWVESARRGDECDDREWKVRNLGAETERRAATYLEDRFIAACANPGCLPDVNAAGTVVDIHIKTLLADLLDAHDAAEMVIYPDGIVRDRLLREAAHRWAQDAASELLHAGWTVAKEAA